MDKRTSRARAILDIEDINILRLIKLNKTLKGISISLELQKKLNISAKSQIFHVKKLELLGLIFISRTKEHITYKYKILELTENGETTLDIFGSAFTGYRKLNNNGGNNGKNN